jgi:hypothetical protein
MSSKKTRKFEDPWHSCKELLNRRQVLQLRRETIRRDLEVLFKYPVKLGLVINKQKLLTAYTIDSSQQYTTLLSWKRYTKITFSPRECFKIYFLK